MHPVSFQKYLRLSGSCQLQLRVIQQIDWLSPSSSYHLFDFLCESFIEHISWDATVSTNTLQLPTLVECEVDCDEFCFAYAWHLFLN